MKTGRYEQCAQCRIKRRNLFFWNSWIRLTTAVFSPFEDDTSTGRDTAFAKIRARVLVTQMGDKPMKTKEKISAKHIIRPCFAQEKREKHEKLQDTLAYLLGEFINRELPFRRLKRLAKQPSLT